MNSPTPLHASTTRAEASSLSHAPLAMNGSRPSRRSVSSGFPKARPWTKKRKLWTAAGFGLALFVLIPVGLSLTGKLFGNAPFMGPTWTVRMEKLKVTLVERGALESANNSDIICTVRSGTKGSAVATTIKWVIDPGAEVKKGDKLMELDSSGFVEQLKDQNIKVDTAKANWVTADEQYRIQESQNESDIEAAKNSLDLARIDLKKYIEGDFVQSIEDVEGRIETARTDVDNWKERASWSARMYKKGLFSKVQAEADESRLEAALIALRKVETEKRVLVDFMKGRTIQDLGAKVAEANRALDRVKNQSRAKLAQADADRLAKDSVYKKELTRKQEIEEEIAKCLVLAPQDGLVVYYVSGGSQQSFIAQGEPVREGQKMMQIPDLSHMVVNLRVREAVVYALHNERNPQDKRTWQLAEIRIDAVPNLTLHGHVKKVDTLAVQQESWAADVKLYKTVVSIDEPVEGLKPGMSAEVTIYADESPTEVLAVPVQAVIGTISMGAHLKCFVMGADGQPELRDIVGGMNNRRLVEVKSGLKEGDRVVLNTASLMGEDGETKLGKAGFKNGDAQDSGDDVNKGKK